MNLDPEIDARLQEFASAVDSAGWKLLQSAPEYEGLYRMIRYHLGWTEGSATARHAGGKKLRSTLTFLVAEAAGADWRCALPAATAMDLVHNFSLIHDDIEDASLLRRGRETVWARWGNAQAINAGDALLMVAYQALFDVEPRLGAGQAQGAYRRLAQACRELCEGQYLDLLWEGGPTVSIEQYFSMIGRKTAGLFQCAAELGALSAGAGLAREEAFGQFARSLGLAFQVADDILGVWSPEIETGKTAALDVANRKKALPATLALSGPDSPAQARLAELYALPRRLEPDETREAIGLLEKLEAREQARGFLEQLRSEALARLDEAAPGDAGAQIRALVGLALPVVQGASL
ncbi:MAG: polyprenyl synthetase family protein [Chloroflexi bacterium]|nr:polyprenyl synthetase family protein [Chloroflexota bacterium]